MSHISRRRKRLGSFFYRTRRRRTPRRPILLHPINVPVKKEKEGQRKKKNERRKKAGRCFYYIAIYSFFFFFFFVPFFFFVSFEIYARLIQRVFTVRDEAQEIKKRMLCHISAIDRCSWLSFSSYRRLGLARGKKCNNNQNAHRSKRNKTTLFLFLSPPPFLSSGSSQEPFFIRIVMSFRRESYNTIELTHINMGPTLMTTHFQVDTHQQRTSYCDRL